MDMMNQYKEETSQIHAPADLIQRTKQAVRKEERRIEQLSGYADKPRRQSYNKVYKWALPAAAAVLFVVLMNVSSMMIGRKFSSSQSDEPMEMTSEMADDTEETAGAAYDFAAAGAAEEEAAVDDMDGGIDKAFAENGFAEESAAVADESVAASEEEASDLYEESSAAEAPAASKEYDSVEDAVKESDLSDDSVEELIIQEVKAKPEFCDNKSTQCIDSHGLQFYVARERGNQWKAYVCVDETGYVITGSGRGIPDREAFAEKAYELLAETVDGIE